MHNTYPVPVPLFDTLENLSAIPESIYEYLHSLAIPSVENEFKLCLDFLKSYSRSADTFTAYRREIERLLLWAWLICKKPLKEISRHEINDYLQFVNAPPLSWIAIKNADRFVADSKGQRKSNLEWRPFVLRTSKINRLQGKLPDKSTYQLANKSIAALFATLSSLFTFLQRANYLDVNPISLVRQKKMYPQPQQTQKIIRKLSKSQWLNILETAKNMAHQEPRHQRTSFLISAFYLLGLRISELATPGYVATMGNFTQDKEGLWWYTTVNKKNKIRYIAVPDELLDALKRYRNSLGFTPLPDSNEDTPLLPKIKGKHGLGSRQIRNVVQTVFNNAVNELLREGKKTDAEDLAIATVHWLRPEEKTP